MSFKKFIIETHLKMVDYKIVNNSDGTYSVQFKMAGGDDQEIRRHAAAHAAMHMNQMLKNQQFDSPKQAEQAAIEALKTQKGGKGDYHDETLEEEGPANVVGSGQIAGINPPAGPAPLTDRNLRGVAAGYTPEQIADRHGVSIKKIMKQIEMGVNVEKEHTDNEQTAMKIAMDHVFEDPKYYSKLSKMESKGKPKDIGNDTKFIGTSDPLAKYRVGILQTRRTTTNKPGDERI